MAKPAVEMKVGVRIPKKLAPIMQPHRYKILYGGRGGAKSRSVAQALLVKGMMEKRLILCTRELQKSIKDSVHRVLATQIDELGLQGFYEVQKQTILGINGTEFIFTGLRNNTAEIKSLEGVDDCWCEEAENISDESWDILIPTIRKDGSEIWVTFNPDDEMGATWQRFVVNPPDDALVIEINYWDNPFFPETLRRQMEEMKEVDYQKYLHIWEGKPNVDYEDSLIRPEWFDAAVGAHEKLGFDPEGIRVVSFDPADDGSDEKSLVFRHGVVVKDVKAWLDGDITTAIPRAFDYAEDVKADCLVYDSIGIGASVKVALMARDPVGRRRYMGFSGSDRVEYPDQLYNEEKPNKEMFRNRRAQYYWHLRDRFEKTYLAVEKGRYIDPQELISIDKEVEYLSVLKSELCRIKRKRSIGSSLLQVESKEDMKRDGRKSPNRADALMMSFYARPETSSVQRIDIDSIMPDRGIGI